MLREMNKIHRFRVQVVKRFRSVRKNLSNYTFFFELYVEYKNILVQCEVTSFDGMLILATSLPFRFSSRNISFALAHTLRRGLRFLACQCALFNYCCSRACKFKATVTIPRPVATSVQIYNLRNIAMDLGYAT